MSKARLADFGAATLCMGIGLLLAVLPHLAVWIKSGNFEYLASGDDVFYLALARAPFYGESALRDPFSARSDGVATPYSWLQFVPLARLANYLGLCPLLMGLLWRPTGGLLLGLGLFLLFRQVLRDTRAPTAWALGATVMCLADAKMLFDTTTQGGKSRSVSRDL